MLYAKGTLKPIIPQATIILNGVKLQGMKASKIDGHWLVPLIAFATAIRADFTTDALTNRVTFVRNGKRATLVPIVSERIPGVLGSVATIAKNLEFKVTPSDKKLTISIVTPKLKSSPKPLAKVTVTPKPQTSPTVSIAPTPTPHNYFTAAELNRSDSLNRIRVMVSGDVYDVTMIRGKIEMPLLYQGEGVFSGVVSDLRLSEALTLRAWDENQHVLQEKRLK